MSSSVRLSVRSTVRSLVGSQIFNQTKERKQKAVVQPPGGEYEDQTSFNVHNYYCPPIETKKREVKSPLLASVLRCNIIGSTCTRRRRRLLRSSRSSPSSYSWLPYCYRRSLILLLLLDLPRSSLVCHCHCCASALLSFPFSTKGASCFS